MSLNRLDSTKNGGLLIIKLGGSIITFKDKPLTPNYHAIERLSGVIKELKNFIKLSLYTVGVLLATIGQ